MNGQGDPASHLELHVILESVMEQLRLRDVGAGFDVNVLRDLVTVQGPEALQAILPPAGFDAIGRIQQGSVADVPWMSVSRDDTPASAKSGAYLVYLFAKDGSRVYLSLNQGTEDVRGGKPVLVKRALDMRHVAGVDAALALDLDLKSLNERPKRYEAGSAAALEYRAGHLRSDSELQTDLDEMRARLDSVIESGLTFDPEVEPLHLLFKWNTDVNPRTIGDHQQISEAQGSVWWGRFAGANTKGVSKTKVSLLRRQLDDGFATYAFLYRRGDVWRARIEGLTDDREAVRDDPRFPAYYTPDDCNFFVRLSNFESLQDGWVQERLLLASNPDPGALPGALGNQTTPLFVFQRFDPSMPEQPATATRQRSHRPADAPEREPLTLDWLQDESLVDDDLLDEILEALEGRFPQIALAGPPGTGKTHLAELLARYLTQDEPLAHRVVQFHPSYTYEEFVEGLRPISEAGSIKFDRRDGTVLATVDSMSDGDRRVLILDEMNRANLPRVFGELMYLLEKRDKPIDLLYSEGFELPAGVMFVGTMNTADRSIRSIDIALRRRFAIFELPPNRKVLEDYYRTRSNEVADLLEGFDRLNEDLTGALDRHHTIGHTFFMAENFTHRLLRQVWNRQLAPLLEEFFFDQPDVAASFSPTTYWPSLVDAD